MLADAEIYHRIGNKIRRLRLRQNFTQMLLAEQAQISVIGEEEMSPNEYYEFMKAAKNKERRRASSRKSESHSNIKEESEW